MLGFAEDPPDPSWPLYERLGYRILWRGETTMTRRSDRSEW